MLASLKPLLQQLQPQRRPSRILYAFGAFWTFSALVHTAVLVATGLEWAGAVSWRKPIVFGLSIGLLLATTGWILDRLPHQPRLAGALAWTLAISSSIEVGLITLQAWRGEASHFNVFDGTNALVFVIMGVMVGVMSLCLLGVFVWALVRRPRNPLISWAVIGGMALVMLGLGIGQWLVQLGNDFASVNAAVPETVVNGEAGVPKFPHAIAFHGIQVFIIAAIALGESGGVTAARMNLMRSLVGGYSLILLFASAQAVAGVAPLGSGGWTALMILTGIGTAGVGAAIARVYITRPVRRGAAELVSVG